MKLLITVDCISLIKLRHIQSSTDASNIANCEGECSALDTCIGFTNNTKGCDYYYGAIGDIVASSGDTGNTHCYAKRNPKEEEEETQVVTCISFFVNEQPHT